MKMKELSVYIFKSNWFLLYFYLIDFEYMVYIKSSIFEQLFMR